MRKKSRGAERAGKNGPGADAKAGRLPEPPAVPKSRPVPAASAPVARIASRAPKSLMKTSDLATRASAPRRNPAAVPLPAAASYARPRKPSPPGKAAAGRQQKIEERIAAATEELASGLTEAASAAEELRRSMEQIASGAEEAASASQETLAVATNTAATLVQARDRTDAVRRRHGNLAGAAAGDLEPDRRLGRATSSTTASARPARSPSSSS